ncbi:MAG TPA: formyltransferase family protein [Polyangiaceae bacterium]|nr:formyltransferase family protein [Polyangiaceae bacterium]
MPAAVAGFSRERVIRVAYFGLPLGALALASRGFEPSLTILSPTQAPGRRRIASRLKHPVIDAKGADEATSNAAIGDAFERTRPDLIASWYWPRRILGKWLERAPLGGIGAHPSLLPRHRGPDPFFWAIDSGDETTGVSVHRLVEAYDEGDVLLSETLAVGDRDAWQLARALDRPSLRLFVDAVARIAAGEALRAAPQDERRATRAPEPTGELLRVDWTWSTERVLRRVRALSPVPGLALEIRDVEFFVTGAEAATAFPAVLAPGEASIDARAVVVRTGDGAVSVTRAALDDGEAVREMDGVALAATLGVAGSALVS